MPPLNFFIVEKIFGTPEKKHLFIQYNLSCIAVKQ